MDCSICATLEASFIGEWLRSAPVSWLLVETVHVIAITMLFGTIAIVDLRLLGIPSNRHSFSAIAGGLLKWTWVCFALAVVTGLLMFITAATIYFNNLEFLLKMLVIFFAGVNMLVFELFTVKSVRQWDRGVPVPLAGKAAGAMSLVLWTTVIFLGRWVGFTKGVSLLSAPIDINMDFGAFQ